MRGFLDFHKRKSSEIARDRLDTMVLADRLKASPETIEQMKLDIRNVLERYLEIDPSFVEIQIQIRLEQEMEQKNDVKTIQIKGL